MTTTTYIKDTEIAGPDGPIYMELHKSPSGGFFCVEVEYLDQVGARVFDPYGEGGRIVCQDPEDRFNDEV